MDGKRLEYNVVSEQFDKLQKQISELPKGSIRTRIINGREYYYLQYRDGQHVRSRYIKPDEAEDLQLEIETRKGLEAEARGLQLRLNSYAQLLCEHRSYRPIKNVDYESYSLFMSSVAHDYKSMDIDSFIIKYNVSKYRGINKRYLAGFFDYINGVDRQNMRRTNDLVLDPYTYIMYFKYGQKEVLKEELKKAIPAFLNRGLLITNIQEAVNGAFSR